MTNIEKLYGLTNIDKKLDCQRCGAKELKSGKCFDVDCESTYPPFTDTKQLELIKWIGSEYETIEITWYSDTGFRIVSYNHLQDNSDFSQALAGLVRELWEDLTDEQREEVRGILK